MAQYLTYEYLQEHRSDLADQNSLNEVRTIMYRQVVKVFLSHRHSEDQTVIDSVKGFFYDQGAVYIDWQDSNMLDSASVESGRKFVKLIKDSQKFIILASPDCLKSIWVPWETGLADLAKGPQSIALLPVVHEYSSWDRREYFNFYSRIELLNNQWQVIQPDNRTAAPIKDWIRAK